MPKPRKKDMLLGTLDLLILRTLNSGEKYGYAIGKHIELLSSEILSVQKGSLYPALHRLENEGFIKSKWKTGDSNKPMKVYSLTSAGNKQMTEEINHWELITKAVNLVIDQT